ncbi:cofG [Symbiodinium sp. KB8]|nr:cofG [Symbiodinium sp. KB8]
MHKGNGPNVNIRTFRWPAFNFPTQGKGRFQRLSKAAREGKHAPPADLRFLCKPFKEPNNDRSVRSEIVSFLEGIYQSVAETLPDVRDDPMDGGDIQIMIGAKNEAEDEYAAAVSSQIKASSGKRPRKFRHSVPILRSNQEVRFLPPGNMKDYWLQLNASRDATATASTTTKPISFSQFWRVWCGEFVHLKFRQQSSHAQCAECIKHKLLIRELSHHLVARQEQVRRYTEHLRSQYYDRVQYWNLRGLSRMRSGAHISCIIDSMDQSKTLLPRSDLCRAKDLSTLIRPKCHITTVIVHGHFVLMALSNHDMPKNSSVMVELMANVLSRLQSVCCLPDVHLHVQADNTVREMKNNPFLKFLSTMTGQGQARDKVFRGVLREASLQNLRSGHSHEDVDQLFGLAIGALIDYILLRKGFLSEGVPVMIQGLQGPGPEDLKLVDEKYWRHVDPMPQDVILRPFLSMVVSDRLRCKQYMADKDYMKCLNYFPRNDYKDHLSKFLGTLRGYGLKRAADFLQAFLEERLDLAPLLDVSAMLV